MRAVEFNSIVFECCEKPISPTHKHDETGSYLDWYCHECGACAFVFIGTDEAVVTRAVVVEQAKN